MYPHYSHVCFLRRHPLAMGPISWYFYFYIFWIRILLPLLLCIWLNFRFLSFIVYVKIVVCYDFVLYGIYLLPFLVISFMLYQAFLLWPGCWASLYCLCHLGCGQKATSTTDTSCYCHCDDYSSDRPLQCWLTKILPLLNLSMLAVSHVNQCNNFIPILGKLKDCWYAWYFFSFHALWTPKNCVISDQCDW